MLKLLLRVLIEYTLRQPTNAPITNYKSQSYLTDLDHVQPSCPVDITRIFINPIGNLLNGEPSPLSYCVFKHLAS